jgi:hypothetical protein
LFFANCNFQNRKKLIKKVCIPNTKQVGATVLKTLMPLFFEFLIKESKDNLKNLTKTEYYTYTIKIAIYSESKVCYTNQKKDEATSTKEEWFSKKLATI